MHPGFAREYIRCQRHRRKLTVAQDSSTRRIAFSSPTLLHEFGNRSLPNLLSCLFVRDRRKLKSCRRNLLAPLPCDPIVSRCVGRLFGTFRQRRSHRIEIHLHGARQQDRFIGNPLGFKESLPKPSRAFVVAIDHSGNRFREGSHEPRNVR
jgi:hypothetical protein